ncbi:MAG: ubiquinone/menaquinone biosynthesis methyltransferase [Acidimicrobiia bacterium]|nr:ubiquinone/menaquinone biosynthesis methyltransferase [Acidimicrobiia bacterium]
MSRRRHLDVALPQGEDKVVAVRDMFDRIAPRYDLVNRVMTFRMDVGWRRRLVRDLSLPPGALVLDLACGTGDLCRELAGAGLVPTGVDLSWGMLARARTNAPLVQADILCLPVPDGAVDGISCGFALRNVVDLGAFLDECARVTRPGGRLGLLEVDEPGNPLVRRGHALYFGRVVPWVGARLSDPAAYRYLPRSAEYLPPREELLGLVRAAGFEDVEHHELLLGAAQLVLATRRPTGRPG